MTDHSGYALVKDAMVIVEDDRIAWAGPRETAPDNIGLSKGFYSDTETFDCGGRLITPGLIDCHTHLVYAGNRAGEFEQRLEGASYADIAKRGGGIMSTVSAVRKASVDSLVEQSAPRLARLISEGVTTVEIKSGYGLDSDNEIKMLKAARQLGDEYGVRVRTTFLGAHALPPEYANRPDDYIDHVINEMLPRAHDLGLVDAVDAFCENIAFTAAQVERVFEAAAKFSIPLKCHAEQLSDMGGAVMAARHRALSADHLEYLNPDDVPILAKAGTVAVLLPGAFYFLRETKLPPLDALRKFEVPIAVASDCNPGSSPLTSLLLTMNMACTLFRMTPAEALAGVTVNAARALGLADQIGTLQAGRIADLVIWNVDEPAELSMNIGLNPCAAVMTGGHWRSSSAARFTNDFLPVPGSGHP